MSNKNTKSPFAPIPLSEQLPESCRTFDIFSKLYPDSFKDLFNPKQTKIQYYEKYTKIIPIDRCFCYYQDLGFTILKKDFASGSAGSVSLVEYKGHKYIVKVTKLHHKISIDNEIKYKYKLVNSIKFIGLHTFTLDTIVTYVVNNLFRNKLNVASTIQQYGTSLCPKFGIQVLENANGGDLRSFIIKNEKLLSKHGYIQKIADKPFVRRDLFTNILLQTLSSLLYAQQKLNFIHNDLKLDNVLISYTLDETTGKLRFQTKLADNGKASIKYGDTVIHLNSQTKFDDYEKYFDPNSTYEVPKTFIFKRNSEMSLYYSSFDIYVLFVSLLTEYAYLNTFFYQFDEKSVFYKCWQILFPESDTFKLMKHRVSKIIKNFTRNTARATIVELTGIKLYNNVLPKLVEVLRKDIQSNTSNTSNTSKQNLNNKSLNSKANSTKEHKNESNNLKA